MFLETARRDLAWALRSLRRNPLFAFSAIVTLSIGVGANTAMFSIANGALWRPLPFAHPERLVQVNEVERNLDAAVVYGDVLDWREHSASAKEFAVWNHASRRLAGSDGPERIQTVQSERSLFRVLEAGALAGRTFSANDPPDVAILSESLWTRRFGRDPGMVGQRIRLEGDQFTVIGIMPDAFRFPYREPRVEAWTIWEMPPAPGRRIRVSNVLCRLHENVSAQAARSELSSLARREVRISLLSEVVSGRARRALKLLLAAVGLVLLIACANVSNLLLARAARRSHELAIRHALGAGRGRLARQLLTESLLLGLAGGGAGLLVAAVIERLVLRLAAPLIPRAAEIGLDWRVFTFAAAVSATAGLIFGSVPAYVAARARVSESLRRAGEGRTAGLAPTAKRLSDALAVSEIALAFVLVAAAGWMLRSFREIAATPPGLAVSDVLTMRLNAPLREYPGRGSYSSYLERLERRVSRLPGVRHAGFIQFLPMQNWGWAGTFQIRGHAVPPDRAPKAELRYVTPGYFATVGIPLRRGRTFDATDTPDAPVRVVVNETLARLHLDGRDPVGQTLDRGEIIGVVGDVRSMRLDRPPTPEIYYSFAQNPNMLPDAGVAMVVAADGNPGTLAGAVRNAVREVNPNEAVYDIQNMEQVVAASYGDKRFYLGLAGSFALLSLLLAATGIYGVIAQLAGARTREFGLRIALGARPAQIFGSVLRHGALLCVIGIGVGAAMIVAALRALSSLTPETTAGGPAASAGAALLLAAVSLAAAIVPARHAMAIDPHTALRHE